MRTGYADLPLHHGSCPPWLFQKMRELGRVISEAIVLEYGHEEFLRRMADPFFFQSLGCVLGFDWHSSGLTTTVCGALKEAIIPEEMGIAICGGKGKASRQTPQEIQKIAERLSLSDNKIKKFIHASRLAAKIDNTAVQDGYNLYHHTIIFTENGSWAVIQQGMNQENRYARRYHWLSDSMNSFVQDPHFAICCDARHDKILNMVARESANAQKVSVDLVNDSKEHLRKHLVLVMSREHGIKNMKKIMVALERAHEVQPKDYEQLLGINGIGPKTIRALALISDLIYGEPPSWRDPAKYSFAHGGKDGIPYPVDRERMEKSTEILKNAIRQAKIGDKSKISALKRLAGDS